MIGIEDFEFRVNIIEPLHDFLQENLLWNALKIRKEQDAGQCVTPFEINLQLYGCTDNTQNLKPITALAMMPSILNFSSRYSNFACSVQRYLPSTPRNILGAIL
jgi:hypothetical protein